MKHFPTELLQDYQALKGRLRANWKKSSETHAEHTFLQISNLILRQGVKGRVKHATFAIRDGGGRKAIGVFFSRLSYVNQAFILPI